eukprot:scaffold865_cov312-Prasinococcus_capsulatus_cf.AAC.4
MPRRALLAGCAPRRAGSTRLCELSANIFVVAVVVVALLLRSSHSSRAPYVGTPRARKRAMQLTRGRGGLGSARRQRLGMSRA